MAKSAPPEPRPRPLLAIAGVAGALLVVALGWYAWRITSAVRPPAGAPTARAPASPPAPDIPYNRLVSLSAPVVAPAIDLPTAGGKRFSLAEARGEVVVVNFWATWCPPCAKEMPSMVKLGQELTARYPGKFRMVAVSVDDQPGAVQQFFSAKPFGGLPRDVVVALEPGAGEVTRGYYCRGRGACNPDEVKFPETYIVDRAGRIMAVVVGDIDWSQPTVRLYLETLIQG
jgi:thiol-disulfide isomerase/thioredoxin